MSGRVQPRFICSRALALFKIYLVRCAVLFLVDRVLHFLFAIRLEAYPQPPKSCLASAQMPPRKFCKKILELILLVIEQTSLRPKQRRRGGQQ